jgi:L-lysine 2,3-aminomutase
LERLIERLAALPNITAIRVRSHEAVVAPESLSRRDLDVLVSANRLGSVAPLRVELELRILHESELTSMHGDLANRLRRQGVTMYVTTLMLSGLNADPESVRGISSACRRHGIEFHHLVVAGDPAQQAWNANRPIDIAQVIDIASELRRTGSGRELPRYVAQTALGEVDLGLTAEPVEAGAVGRVRLRLLPFTVTERGEVDPWGELPAEVEVDQDGHPIVPVAGLTC